MRKFLAATALSFGLMSGSVFAQSQEDADAKFTAQDWQGAANDYRVLLAEDETNAQNWFRLARALHQLEEFDAAEDAYAAAIEAGFSNPSFARYQLARLKMQQGRERQALELLEQVAQDGGVPGAFIQNTAEFAPLADNSRFQTVVTVLTPCTADEYRHFDFWLGEWDVTGAGATQATASSKISSRQAGCVVLEEYTAGGFTGMSISFYDSVTERWHQSWMSNAGTAVYLEGGLDENGAMVMSDKGMTLNEVTGVVNRTTWSPNDDGSVRQLWEQSSDDGETWIVIFDGTYTTKESDQG
ncbi:MAG: hypothetical protein AAFW68_01690 [Pseudomonadota bacterium]